MISNLDDKTSFRTAEKWQISKILTLSFFDVKLFQWNKTFTVSLYCLQ